MTGSQIDINEEAYRKDYVHLETDEASIGKFALMHDGKLEKVYSEFAEAFAVGLDRFGRDQFTVKEIGAKPVSLGAYSLLPAGN